MDYLKSISRVVLGKDIPSFPYNIGEKVDLFEGVSIWSLHDGTKKVKLIIFLYVNMLI
jgi:SCY1-like protein 1